LQSARAGIVLISQDRFADVVSDDGRHQHQAATDFGPFNINLDLNGVGAFQQSTLDVTPDGKGAKFHALLAGHFGLGVQHSQFSVNFNVTDSALPFTLSYSSLTASEAGPGPGPTGSFTGPSAPGTLVNGDALSGTLDVGQYALQTDANFNGTIQLDLAIGASTSTVPLPPAVRAAATLLPALALAIRFAGRRHAVRVAGSEI